LRDKIDAMFNGEKINIREPGRLACRVARAERASIFVDGKNVVPEVHECSTRWLNFPTAFAAAHEGPYGKRIKNVINVGIGGSDLGPVMAYEALKHYSDAR